MRRILLSLLALLWLCTPVFAWSQSGHMVVAAIAYDLLAKEHPRTLRKVLAVLRQHPQYADVLSKRLDAVPPEQRDRYLFMIAARWPDDIRDKPQYHHGPWHYVNFPVVAPGATVHPAAHPPEPNVLTALADNTRLLDGHAPDADKAVALCWIFHLVGDVHQPLHAVSFFGPQWPDGDRGGNLFYVRAEQGGEEVSLHALWDGAVLRSQRYQAVSNTAIELRNRPAFAPAKLKELNRHGPEQWARESVQLARTVAYQDGKLAGSPDRRNAPVLPAGYTDAMKAAAERRVVLAGYRLADALVTSFSP